MTLDDFLNRFTPPGRLLFAKVWGSRSHNTHKEMSDTDFAGVYMHPTKDILSVRLPHEPNVTESWVHDNEGADKRDKPDYQFHEVGHFAKLLLKGNPAVVELLFSDKMCMMTPEWEQLRAIRKKFLSQEVVKQYVGYMQGQLRRLIAHDGKAGLHTSGGAYTEKWAYHVLRLGGDAHLIATGKEPQIWIGSDSDRHALLMKVRNNEFDWPAVKAMIEGSIRYALNTTESMPEWGDKKGYEKWMDKALAAMPIPQYGDADALNYWLLGLRKGNW